MSAEFDPSKVHLGHEIKKAAERMGIRPAALGKMLNKSREWARHAFERPTQDTGVLLQLREILKVDFFQFFTTEGYDPNPISPRDIEAVLRELDAQSRDRDRLLELVGEMEKREAKIATLIDGILAETCERPGG